MSVRACVLAVALLTACGGDGLTTPFDPTLARWGGDGIAIEARLQRVVVHLPCISAESSEPLAVRADSTFEVQARYVVLVRGFNMITVSGRVSSGGDLIINGRPDPLRRGARGDFARYNCAPPG